MSEDNRHCVLIVEDEIDLLTVTSMQLKRCGYEVECAKNGSEAVSILQNAKIDIVLLDIMLPDCDGHELCTKIRDKEIAYTGPVIFMSCLGDSTNIVESFRKGGNDYIVKPAKIDNLIERIEANLKKLTEEQTSDTRQWYKQFMIDKNKHSVYRVEGRKVGEEIALSPTEYNILVTMTEHPEEVLLYRQLYKSVWELEDLGDVRTLMVHVSNLRKKVDRNHTEMIRAIRGVGYLFQDM